MSGCACHGAPVGDPRAVERLREIVQDLRDAVRTGGCEAGLAVMDRVEEELNRYFRDANPRTRAQVRGLFLVRRLVAAGEVDEAVSLLDEELLRSFPDPRAHPDPGEATI